MKCPHCELPIDVRLIKAPPMQSDSNGNGSQEGGGDVGELLSQCHSESMTPWEEKFVAETKERLEKWGDRIRMSDKQMDTLRKIAAK